jgi:hypothetical protein
MKRAIIPEQPVPASLADLQEHHQAAASLQGATSSSSSSTIYSGPIGSLQTGDYVAVYVQQLGGTSTLLGQPLARTGIQEFAQVFGSTTPGLQQIPPWVHVAVLGEEHDQRLAATAGL